MLILNGYVALEESALSFGNKNLGSQVFPILLDSQLMSYILKVTYLNLKGKKEIGLQF